MRALEEVQDWKDDREKFQGHGAFVTVTSLGPNEEYTDFNLSAEDLEEFFTRMSEMALKRHLEGRN